MYDHLVALSTVPMLTDLTTYVCDPIFFGG